MTAENKNYLTDNGNIQISEEVICTISNVAALEVDGIHEMSGNITTGIAEILGKKNTGKGVKVGLTSDEVAIDLSVIIKYGVKIPDVAWEVQKKVTSAVETMTGLKVTAVNIHIEGLFIEKDVQVQQTDVEEKKAKK